MKTIPTALFLAVSSLALAACSDARPQAERRGAQLSTPVDTPTSTPRAPQLPGYVTAEIPVGNGPGYLVAANGSIWVGDHPGQTITRIDPATDEVVDTIPMKGEPTSMASGFGRVWTHTVLTDNKLVGIDPGNGKVAVQVPYKGEGGSINGIVAGAGSIWLAQSNGTVLRTDPNGRVEATIEVAAGQLCGLTYGAGAIWCASRDDFLWRIDTATHQVDRFKVGGGAWNPVFGSGELWVPLTSTGHLARVDPATGEVTDKLRVGSSVEQLRLDADDLWVRVSDTELAHVDASKMKVIKRYELPSASIPGGGISVGFGSVWVANFSENTVWRIDPDA